MNHLRDRWYQDLTPERILTEKDNVTVSEECNANPVMNVLKYSSENYERDESIYIDKDRAELFSSDRFLLVAHNASGFDSWVLWNSLVKEITELKIIKKLLDACYRCHSGVVLKKLIRLKYLNT